VLLRFSISAAHTREQIDAALKAFREAARAAKA